MFNRKVYLEKQWWKNDEHLVDPETGIKKCVKCDAYKYSVEFPNVSESFDGLLPICIKCYGKRDGQEVLRTLIDDDESMARICRKCKVEYALSNFSYSRPRNELNRLCRECGKFDVGNIWDKNEEDDENEMNLEE